MYEALGFLSLVMYVCVRARVRALYLHVYGHCVQMSMLMNSESEVFLNRSPHFQAGLLTAPELISSTSPAGQRALGSLCSLIPESWDCRWVAELGSI